MPYSFSYLEPVCCSMSSSVFSWPPYRFLKRQVRWSGIPISFRIFLNHEKEWNNAICSKVGGPRGFSGAQTVKSPPAMQENQVPSLHWEDPLEKGTATHFSILAWRMPWTEEPGNYGPKSRKEWDTTEATKHAHMNGPRDCHTKWSQKEEDKSHMILLTCEILKKKKKQYKSSYIENK